MTVLPSVLVVLLLVAMTGVSRPAHANELTPRLRPLDAQMRALLRHGLEHSPSFRALVERLTHSDVVVYIRCARLPSRVDGQLTFLSAAAGLRYVIVDLAWDRTTLRKVATLGHELQHAVEIAERPGIVDEASLIREFGYFAFSRDRSATFVAFDTPAAIGAGDRVWRELAGARSAAD